MNTSQKYAQLVSNCSRDFKHSLVLEPREFNLRSPYTFVHSVNFIQLFKNIDYWYSAKISLCVIATLNWDKSFVDAQITIPSSSYIHIGLSQLPKCIIDELEEWVKYRNVHDVTVSRLIISFQ